MGAYTLTLSNTFNGFPIPTVRPFIRESQWLMSLYLHKRYANIKDMQILKIYFELYS